MIHFPNEEYRRVFFKDTDNILEMYRQDFLRLKSPEGQQDALKNIYRHAHSFKGLFALMGLEDMRAIAERLETIVKKACSENISSVSGELLSEIEQGFQIIDTKLEEIRAKPLE